MMTAQPHQEKFVTDLSPQSGPVVFWIEDLSAPHFEQLKHYHTVVVVNAQD